MTNDTVNENIVNEKTIHERIEKIEIRIIALQEAIQSLCNHMIKSAEFKDKVGLIDEYISQLSQMKLQLTYIDDVFQDKKLQQQNEPLIIKEKK